MKKILGSTLTFVFLLGLASCGKPQAPAGQPEQNPPMTQGTTQQMPALPSGTTSQGQ